MRSKRQKHKHSTPAAAPRGNGLLRHGKWLLPGLLALPVLLWCSRDDNVAATPQRGAQPDIRSASAFGPGGLASASNQDGAATTTLTPQQAQEKLELADQTLCHYQQSTQYPNSARPISEHPDQVYPNRALEERHALRKPAGGANPDIQLSTSQSRVYVAAGESISFSLRASDKEGKSLPLQVTRAEVRGIVYGKQRAAPQFALDFSGSDSASSTLTPAHSGLAQFNGTVQVEVRYHVADNDGVVTFDFIYTPENPASWTGAVREALEGGSLNFYLPLEVRMPGRYLVSARLDDAKGQPFALLSFNDILPAGSQEIRLQAFGKLMRDQDAAMPLTLRDVDAYLLKENTDPDRALMPRLNGNVHVSKTYALKNFSDAEWQSEERSRYLTEFDKDLTQARNDWLAAHPGMDVGQVPASQCQPRS